MNETWQERQKQLMYVVLFQDIYSEKEPTTNRKQLQTESKVHLLAAIHHTNTFLFVFFNPIGLNRNCCLHLRCV